MSVDCLRIQLNVAMKLRLVSVFRDFFVFFFCPAPSGSFLSPSTSFSVARRVLGRMSVLARPHLHSFLTGDSCNNVIKNIVARIICRNCFCRSSFFFFWQEGVTDIVYPAKFRTLGLNQRSSAITELLSTFTATEVTPPTIFRTPNRFQASKK